MNWIKTLVLDSRFRLLRYLMFWIFIFLDELLSIAGITLPFEPELWFYVSVVLDIGIVLLINYLLLPGLFYKGKYLLFALSFIVLIALNMLIVFSIDPHLTIDQQELATELMASFISTASIYGMAVGIKLGKKAYLDLELRENSDKERMRSELKYLKEQVNPHFLFNVLNSIHIQATTDPESVSDTVLRLSDLLRYQIYDATRSDTISLRKEMEFLHNYLEIEKMRRENLQIEWEESGDVNGHVIEPLLFLPLVDNAVKYSGGTSEKPGHIIVKWLLHMDEIKLELRNSVSGNIHGKVGGFGLANLRERLRLAYPDRHSLFAEKENDEFVARLTIQTNELHSN